MGSWYSWVWNELRTEGYYDEAGEDIVRPRGGPRMQPIRPLMAEHQTILHMTANIARQVKSFREAGRVEGRYVDAATDFIRTYADGCHHGKEEGILFRELAKKDLDPKLGGLMGQLIREHAWARTLTQRLVDLNQAGSETDPNELENVLRPLHQLASFYPGHITKEESRFFAPCMDYFTLEEQEAMLREFAEFDRTLIHEKYQRLMEELERGSDV